MLPPVGSTALSNPQFSRLYKILTGSLLNSDGDGSLHESFQEARTSVEKAIHIAQTRSVKTALIRSTLTPLSYGSNKLPDKLQEVIHIISAELTTPQSPSERDMLSDDLIHFLNHLLPIGEALSSELSKSALHLKRIVYREPRQDMQTKPPNLTYFVQTRRKGLALARETLSDPRLKLAIAASGVLRIHRDIVEIAIRVLEQTKLGSIARGIKAQTEHLAIVAESMDAKLQVMDLEALNESYTPEVQTALARYKRHLEDARANSIQTGEQAKMQLQEYESSGKSMEEIAERFAELQRTADVLGTDVKRLGGEV